MCFMPSAASKKVKIRAAEAARLLRMRGCIAVRAVMELGFSRTQAESALRYLAASGRAVRVKVGRVAFWCYSRKSAVRHMRRLRRALHSLVCAAGLRHVAPKEALELVMRDKSARRLFSRYIVLSRGDAAALHFMSGLLAAAYGKPAFYLRAGREPLYFARCGRRLPPLPPELFGQQRQKKQYRSVQVKVDRGLRDALVSAAKAEGVSISELVRRAVERLLEKHLGGAQSVRA